MNRTGIIRRAALFLCISVIFTVGISAESEKTLYLIPGGVPFGVKLYSEGVSVVDVCEVVSGGEAVSPAKSAGIVPGDVISAVNGSPVIGAEQVAELVNESRGKAVELSVRRDDGELSISVTPVTSDADGKYRTGLIIRDGTSGIGTVTYIDPANGAFAGLGHGICDLETGEPVPLTRGAVLNVEISGIIRGCPGSPGELKGYFSSGKIGTIFKNSECGVYGLFSEYPRGVSEQPIPAAIPGEITVGEAKLLCTLDGGGVRAYKAYISDIDCSGRSVKNFVVTVTDPVLLEKTGGIVQGMSGSPVIQNGKLVGAVTHVFVNDPMRGYGIFIENMLAEAEKNK